jgi:Cof subfamily protein (haloacid dehalogenase superfamily)
VFTRGERVVRVRMIVTDLDRTLLRTDKTISDYTAGVLNRCRSMGMKIAFATARPKRTVNQFTERIPADAVILHNGAVTYIGDRLLHCCGINSKAKDKILLSLSRDNPEATLSVEIDDVLFANFDVTSLWTNTGMKRSDFTDLPDKPADKIIVGVSSHEDMDRFSKYLPDDLYIEISENRLGLIMNRGATKHYAVRKVAEYYGLDMSEIVAFGDDYNDIGMLRACGVGVAVSNALDEVKAAADRICGSNEDDGVARWLEENLL